MTTWVVVASRVPQHNKTDVYDLWSLLGTGRALCKAAEISSRVEENNQRASVEREAPCQ